MSKELPTPGGLLGQAVEALDAIVVLPEATPTICELAQSARIAIQQAAGEPPLNQAAWPAA